MLTVVLTAAHCVAPDLRGTKLRGAPSTVLGFLDGFDGRVIAVYEAGPIGMTVARKARERGIDMHVCAPGLIPRNPPGRVKTDKRDAEILARQLAAGGLSFVRVTTAEEEALRDLVRAREDVRQDLMRARHRLGKFLLRRDLRFEGRNWSDRHAVDQPAAGSITKAGRLPRQPRVVWAPPTGLRCARS